MYRCTGKDNKGRNILVDTKGHLTYEMARCPCCGATNVPAGNRSVHGNKLCCDCSRRVQGITLAKSRLSKHSTLDAVKRQLDRLQYFVDIENNGGLVPDWIDELYAAAQRYIQFEESSKEALDKKRLQEVAAQDMITVKCRYCGEAHLLPVGQDTTKRCPACQKRYKEYTALRTRIAVLDMAECVSLLMLLDEYEVLKKRGYWAPQVPKWRSRTQDRLEELTNESM